MKIIDRYIVSLFLKLLLGAISVLITLYISIMFFDLVDDFVAAHASIRTVLHYFSLKVPEALMHMTPMAVLISAVLAFSVLSKSQEVLIMLSSGVAPFRIALPVILASLLIAILSFLNGEYFLPDSWWEAREIYLKQIKKEGVSRSTRQGALWIKTADASIWSIAFLDSASGRLNDVTVINFAPDGSSFTSILKAKTAYRHDGEWVFENGLERIMDAPDGADEKRFGKRKYPFKVELSSLEEVEKKPQEMSYREIREYVRQIRERGYDDTRYRVDMYAKITFPFISVIMVFVAIPFSLKTGRVAGVMVNITQAVLLGFAFWFLYSMSLSMGHTGRIPPLPAAGGVHAIFLLGAWYLSWKVHGRVMSKTR